MNRFEETLTSPRTIDLRIRKDCISKYGDLSGHKSSSEMIKVLIYKGMDIDIVSKVYNFATNLVVYYLRFF